MTDSMKFGPEWLRNMSSDNSGSGGGSGSNSSGSGNNTMMTTTLMPRFQQAEYRYGREEMLSLCEKDMKLPEILPNFKKLFVEKEQLPLALSPSTEDESVYQFSSRPWPLRSPVSLAPPPRIGRGGSVDRGRGRPRVLSSVSFPARPPFEENTRAVGRGTDRGWPERNGGNDIGGSGDWNGSPSSSPRKEFNSHGRGSGMENWRRNRVEEEGGDGWRSSVSNSGASSYRWSRSTSWRDEESTSTFLGNAASGSGTSGMPPITRSFSSSATVNQSASSMIGNMDRNSNNLNSNGAIYKSLSQGNNSHDLSSTNNSMIAPMRNDASSSNVNSASVSQPSKANAIWDQEDIPEWAMENTTEGGGSFDASGAFHVPNDEEDDNVGRFERRSSRQSPDYIPDMHKVNSANGMKTSQPSEKLDQRTEVESKAAPSTAQENDDANVKSPSNRKTSNSQLNVNAGDTNLPHTQGDLSGKLGILEGVTNLMTQKLHSSPKPEESAPQLAAMQAMNIAENPSLPAILSSELSIPKHTSSDLADRMQEVADDMVEKLIMEDEMTSSATPAGASGQIPLLKSAVTSNSPTGVASHLMQRPIQVHNHPMMVAPPQPTPTPSGELWYYRDPQNKIQGPFTGTEMAEWYRSDYFDENLFVRRVCDSRFATLGELVKMCGNSMPFLSSHLIPPLQNTPVLPLNNQQPSTIVPSAPAPVNISQTKPINIVNPMLNTNEMTTSLNMHLQFLQKEHLLRQSLIFSKLSASEQFALLSPERQQQIQQQMAQATLPDNIVNLPASINFLYGGVNPSPFSMQQIIPGGNNSMGPQKPELNQVKIPSTHNPFIPSGGRADFPVMPPLHNLIQSNSGQPIIQPPPPPPPQQQNTDEHIKAILRHLQTTKTLPPNVGSVYPQTSMPNLQRMPWAGSSANSGGPASMWDFEPLNANISMPIKPEMKTEQQILEEQRKHQHIQTKQQQQQSPEETQVNDQTIFRLNDGSPPSKMIAHTLIQPRSPTSSQLNEQTLSVPQQTVEHPVQQQHVQQPSSKKPDEKMPKSILPDDNSLKNNKIDDAKKPIKTNKVEKKDSSKSQKPNEEDKKREAAEERKKQKEEKKKQQMEEEKKRQQQLQEEEKRRQMLEEKKRQEEIDRHRRAKMLENVPPKSQKQTSDSMSSRSSVAPWSNTGLPGITAPAASLAEIQKAERERRTEERLELINQRKIQQMEMLTKVEPALTWNAHPINVKSLAEIQAEEHKQQQQVAYEHAVAAVVQRRKKDDLTTSQQPFFSAAASQNVTPSSTATQSSSLGSIWSSWNGKPAWSSTSNAGFWEEPAKIPTATGGTSGASKQANSTTMHGGNNGNRLLSKSQTFSNIQTSGKNNQTVATGSVSCNEIRNASNSSGTISSSKPTKGATSTKQIKGSSNSTGNGGGQSTASNNNKKDDARNEFISWCIKTLSTMKSTVDVPTFIQFLQDIESPYEVKDYIRIYLGETKECTEFAKQFLERRSKYKNQQRAQNAHIDDMCSPAPAINPASNDFQEVKGKGKKLKKSKMTKLDARILGFSVTAAQDRINVGDRDYGDNA